MGADHAAPARVVARRSGPSGETSSAETGDGHGQYRWDFSLDSSVVQYLGVGQTLTLNYGTTVTDTAPSAGTHASASQNIVVTITGANDAPIAQPDSGQVVEAGTLLNSDQITFGNPAASGNVLLNASDPDFDFISVSGLAAGTTNAPLTGNIGFAVAGTYGALTISPNGIWGYQLDNNNPNTNALAEGQAVTDVFTYTVIDGHGGSANETITINVAGTNDAPVVSAPLKLEVLEGSSSHQLDLLARASDADGDAIQVASLNIPEGMTSFVSLAADGHTLTFDTNNPDFNILPIGQFSDFVVGYDLVDSHGSVSHQMATFRLVGTDDAPTVSVQNGNAVIEAGGSDPGVAQSQAIITYSDPDMVGLGPGGTPLPEFVAPDTSGWTQNPNGTWSMVGVYGTATWSYGILTYQLDNNDPDTLALGSEDNVYDTFTLTYTDGTLSTSRDVSFEVVGRDDMYGHLIHWEVKSPTKETPAPPNANEFFTVGDQVELPGPDWADLEGDLTRDQVITNYHSFFTYDLVVGEEAFNGYQISLLPTVQSVDFDIRPDNSHPLSLVWDDHNIWVDNNGLTYQAGDQVVYTITFAPGTPINAPAMNPAPVDVGATNQSIGSTVTIYDGFTLDLDVAYSGTVQFQGPAGTLKLEDTDFSGTVDNFETNADFLDFSAITQGNAAIVGELSGTELAAHSIGWVTNGADTTVYVNASDQSEALIDADMAIPLLNVSQLHNQDFIV